MVSVPKFSPLTDAEQSWKAEHLHGARLFVSALSPDDADEPITPESLDRAWSAWLQETGKDVEEINSGVNAVGVQFGQLLVDQAGFQWTIASDAQGTELAVIALPGLHDVLVYPANFVAKRWETQERDFLAVSFQGIRRQVEMLTKTQSHLATVGPPEVAKPPLWRSLLIATILLVITSFRRPPNDFQNRYVVYLILIGFVYASAVALWGIQRWRKWYWPWPIEMFAIPITFAALFWSIAEVVDRIRN
jgi:hypothetical protein